MKIPTGQSIGHYEIRTMIGEGGMATVYRAFDRHLERDVAIKVIRRDAFNAATLENVLKRFEREAHTLARLSHPNIVKVIDYGEYEGNPYLVLEYLSGGTLIQKMGRPVKYDQAARIILPIARALAYAHQRDMLHRDVKPANILISESGDPELSDFGIAKLLEGQDTTGLTSTGVGIGTPEYMAPEQALGKVVDGRVDVYSLGIVYYELVTGNTPYTGDTPLSIIYKHATEPLPSPRKVIPDLPSEVERVIYTALAKRPEERYADMNAFVVALERLAAGSLANGFDAQHETGRVTQFRPLQAGPAKMASETASQDRTPQNQRRIPAWLWILIAGGILSIFLCIAIFLGVTYLNGGMHPTATFGSSSIPTEIAVNPSSSDQPTVTSGTSTPTPQPSQTSEPKKSEVPTLAPELTFTSPPTSIQRRTSASVLWDTSKGPRQGQDGAYDLGGVYSGMVGLAAQNNIQLVENPSAMPECKLTSYEGVIISATSSVNSAYTQGEADCLLQFVKEGGGVIILGEMPGFPHYLDTLAETFGIKIEQEPQIEGVSNLDQHPIFAGVNKLTFYAGGSMDVIGNGPRPVGWSGNSIGVIVSEIYPGRVVAIGDSNLLDNRWLPGNTRFAQNLLRWVAKLSD